LHKWLIPHRVVSLRGNGFYWRWFSYNIGDAPINKHTTCDYNTLSSSAVVGKAVILADGSIGSLDSIDPVANENGNDNFYCTSTNASETLNSGRATVRLGAVRRNYKKINQQVGGETAVAIKANGYGLGAVAVAQTLWSVGCREFFVANVEEGIEVRSALPLATINVLSGMMPNTQNELIEYHLTPTIINLQQLELWQREAHWRGIPLPAGIHIDTGMHRTGLPTAELNRLANQQDRLIGLEINHIISHLACADEIDNPHPEKQLQEFKTAIRRFPNTRASIANSAGIFRDTKFHLDMVRAGIAVYGGNPIPDRLNPMEPAVVLEAPILQVVDAAPGDLIGYGASYRTTSTARHAVVSAGYADGILRSLSNTGEVAIGKHLCAIVGRVSMDLTVVDVTDVPEHLIYQGAPVEFIGDTIKLDTVAAAAGTIGYELLTGIGCRFNRHYTNA